MLKVLLTLSVITLLYSCKKEGEADHVQYNLIADSNEFVFPFVVGNYTGMKYFVPDTTFYGQYHQPPEVMYIDIDSNGINDMGIVSAVGGSPGQGILPRSEFWCLNLETELLGYNTIHLSYHTMDTTFQNSPPDVTAGIINLYSCYWSGINSVLINSANTFTTSIKNQGDTISNNESSKCDSIHLTDAPVYFSIPNHYTVNDTDYTVYTQNNYTCWNFPDSTFKYLVFKHKRASGDKWGWIKLSISNLHIINVKEIAIQW